MLDLAVAVADSVFSSDKLSKNFDKGSNKVLFVIGPYCIQCSRAFHGKPD